jgi:FMN phosphatase YigB (HAD superfamily)
MYLGASHHLSLPPEKVALVAAHIEDLRGAAQNGLRTVYVRRPTEDLYVHVEGRQVDGSQVDAVFDSFEELARSL